MPRLPDHTRKGGGRHWKETFFGTAWSLEFSVEEALSDQDGA